MRTRPELLLLQKTMVVVEGVSRSLDPKLDMWSTAEPVVREWIERNLGPAGRIEDAGESLAELGRFAGRSRDSHARRCAGAATRCRHPQWHRAGAGNGRGYRPRRGQAQPLYRDRAMGDRGVADLYRLPDQVMMTVFNQGPVTASPCLGGLHRYVLAIPAGSMS